MTGVALTTNEKQIFKKLKFKNKAKVLNEFVKTTHKKMKKEMTEKRNLQKKLLKVKDKQVKSFQKEFRKLTNPKPRIKSINEKEVEGVCTTKNLGRIMNVFEINEGKKLLVSHISKETALLHSTTNLGLKFLVRTGLIKEIKENGTYFYIYEKNGE